MWENRSYPFFRIIEEDEAADGPLGSMGAPLTESRSLAVDPRYHQLGLPIWVSAPELIEDRKGPFRHLMIAQDSGSAIRGPVRGDIFWGSGDNAGRKAGNTKHICDFVILIPNSELPGKIIRGYSGIRDEFETAIKKESINRRRSRALGHRHAWCEETSA